NLVRTERLTTASSLLSLRGMNKVRDEAIYNVAYLIVFAMESQNTKITSKIPHYRLLTQNLARIRTKTRQQILQ
ncbi:hypothetical protein, partial [Helicobacter rodentium]